MTAPADRLLETVMALLVSDGFEGVSVRKVAAAAGVSIGAVQHHFPTKDAMLAAAMDAASAEFQERLRRRLPADAQAADALRALCDELLGTGPERRAASVLWLARASRAAVDPATATTHAREWLELEDLLTVFVLGARPDLDQESARREAALLLALVDGLAVAVVTEPARMPAERAEQVLESVLGPLLAPRAD